MSRLYPIVDDFEATIRIFSEAEGGRKSPPFNGIRWDFNYAKESPTDGIYMIWPDFFDEEGSSLPTDAPLPIDEQLRARMHVVVDEMRAKLHRARIEVGTQFFCCEGSKRVAEGKVSKITGLHLAR